VVLGAVWLMLGFKIRPTSPPHRLGIGDGPVGGGICEDALPGSGAVDDTVRDPKPIDLSGVVLA